MSKIDKVRGRAEQAAGDVIDDASMRRKGKDRERKADAKEEAALAEERAEQKAQEVADLERSASSRAAARRRERS